MTIGTASALLGGEAKMVVTAPDPHPATPPAADMYTGQEVRADRLDTSCEFSRATEGGVARLSISITTMRKIDPEFAALLDHCGGNRVALKGLGNEAYRCAKPGTEQSAQSMIVGRVRNRAFVIEIALGLKKADAAGQKKLSEEVEFGAEQVAGNLF